MPKVGIKLCVSAPICRLVVNLDKKNAWGYQAFFVASGMISAEIAYLLRNKARFLH
jgi:hypothetical protein